METVGIIVLGLFAFIYVCRLIYAIGVKLKIFKSPEQRQYESAQKEALAAKSISLEQRIKGLSKYQPVNRLNVPATEAIDLGLSVKWAPVNVGAESLYQSGSYFAWGESVLKGERDFQPNTAMTYGASIEELNRKGITQNGRLLANYDVATNAWGNGWRLPTEIELNELFTRCSNQWVPGIGIELVGPNGNRITLPITGYCDETGERYRHGNVSKVDVVSIWTSTRADDAGAKSLLYDFDNVNFGSTVSSIISTKAYIGLCVRPVHD